MGNDRKLQIWLVAIFLVLVIGGTIVAAVMSQGAQIATAKFDSTTTAAIDSTDHVKGDTASKVTVIEYGDFQCPACGQWEPLVEKLEATYGGKVMFVFRNFPLTQLHQNAMMSSQAAEAAALQGKYWEMHDLLYQKQNEWVNTAPADVVATNFDGYAKSLGLNVTKFNADITSSAVTSRVQRDIASGNAAKVDHTPTFFVNLNQIQNPKSYEDFASILDAQLASSTRQ